MGPANSARRDAVEQQRSGVSDADSLTVDQLAARAGVTVRTVRFYSTR
ncbi:MAG TPA: transcriptional regulator, partial [Streptomyces sp.]|nr:transcriptional regulator [Streptomyces sp.]